MFPRTYTTSVSPDGLHTASVRRAATLDPPDDQLFLVSPHGVSRHLMNLHGAHGATKRCRRPDADERCLDEGTNRRVVQLILGQHGHLAVRPRRPAAIVVCLAGYVHHVHLQSRVLVGMNDSISMPP